SFILLITSILVIVTDDSIAQDYTTSWHLPEGAIMRLGRGTVNDIAYSEDGSQITIVTSIGIWIYDALSGEDIKFIFTENRDDKTISLSPDGVTYVRASSGKIQLYDINTARPFLSLLETEGITRYIFTLNGRKLIGVGKEGLIRAWTFDEDRTLIRTKEIRLGSVNLRDVRFDAVAISPDGKLFAAVYFSQRAYKFGLWDLDTGKRLKGVTSNVRYATVLEFSPDSKVLASGGQPHSGVKFADMESDELRVPHIRPTNSGFITLAYSPKGNFFATANRDGVRLWKKTIERNPPWTQIKDKENRPVLLNRGKSDIVQILFSPDETTLLTLSNIGTVNTWDITTGEKRISLTKHTSSIRMLKFSKANGVHGNRLTSYSGWINWGIRQWDIRLGELLFTKSIAGHDVISPDGRISINDRNDGSLYVWNVKDMENIATLKGQPTQDPYKEITISSNGEMVASGGKDAQIRVWNTKDPERDSPLFILKGHINPIERLAFSADGKTLASSSLNINNWKTEIRLWDINDGSLNFTIKKHRFSVKVLVFSHDGSILGSAANDHTVRLWDTVDATQIATLRNQKGVESLRFAPDNKTLAIGKWDGTVSLWNISHDFKVPILYTLSSVLNGIIDSIQGEQDVISKLEGHRLAVSALEFTQDGSILASGSRDGTILLWDWRKVIAKPKNKD
ncbi:hypothetical protein F4225_01280, partial [Candidatus Poribacteria bacterium]|nr:hypothetical protein [Candidatus Poribacteria bacterium]